MLILLLDKHFHLLTFSSFNNKPLYNISTLIFLFQMFINNFSKRDSPLSKFFYLGNIIVIFFTDKKNSSLHPFSSNETKASRTIFSPKDKKQTATKGKRPRIYIFIFIFLRKLPDRTGPPNILPPPPHVRGSEQFF